MNNISLSAINCIQILLQDGLEYQTNNDENSMEGNNDTKAEEELMKFVVRLKRSFNQTSISCYPFHCRSRTEDQYSQDGKLLKQVTS